MSIDKAVLNEDTEGAFIRSMMQSLVQVTRASNNLPSVEGIPSHLSHVLLINTELTPHLHVITSY